MNSPQKSKENTVNIQKRSNISLSSFSPSKLLQSAKRHNLVKVLSSSKLNRKNHIEPTQEQDKVVKKILKKFEKEEKKKAKFKQRVSKNQKPTKESNHGYSDDSEEPVEKKFYYSESLSSTLNDSDNIESDVEPKSVTEKLVLQPISKRREGLLRSSSLRQNVSITSKEFDSSEEDEKPSRKRKREPEEESDHNGQILPKRKKKFVKA